MVHNGVIRPAEKRFAIAQGYMSQSLQLGVVYELIPRERGVRLADADAHSAAALNPTDGDNFIVGKLSRMQPPSPAVCDGQGACFDDGL